MKLIYTIIKSTALILFALLTSVNGIAQDSLPPELVGNWFIDTNATMAAIPPDNQEQLNSIPGLQQQIITSYTGRSLSLTASGEFNQSLSSGTSISGTWHVSNALLILETDTGAKQEQEFSVLPDGRLLLFLPSQEHSQHIVPNQYYIKQ